jgi:hypothetical protein
MLLRPVTLCGAWRGTMPSRIIFSTELEARSAALGYLRALNDVARRNLTLTGLLLTVDRGDAAIMREGGLRAALLVR